MRSAEFRKWFAEREARFEPRELAVDPGPGSVTVHLGGERAGRPVFGLKTRVPL
jgi:hypothetical protein